MSKHDKRRNSDKKVTSQRWFIIASQEMRSHDQDNEQKKNRKDTKEVDWTDSTENRRRVDRSKRSNHVTLQAE